MSRWVVAEFNVSPSGFVGCASGGGGCEGEGRAKHGRSRCLLRRTPGRGDAGYWMTQLLRLDWQCLDDTLRGAEQFFGIGRFACDCCFQTL